MQGWGIYLRRFLLLISLLMLLLLLQLPLLLLLLLLSPLLLLLLLFLLLAPALTPAVPLTPALALANANLVLGGGDDVKVVLRKSVFITRGTRLFTFQKHIYHLCTYKKSLRPAFFRTPHPATLLSKAPAARGMNAVDMSQVPLLQATI